MKKTTLLLLASFLSFPAFSQENSSNPGIQRPDSSMIINTISSELRLSSKQEERIKRAVDQEAKDFDKLFSEYEKKSKELRDIEYKINELKHKMLKISKNLPDVIREFLDDEQKLKFDQLTAPKPKSEEPKVKSGEGSATTDDQTARPKKKKRILVKRKKGHASKGAPAAGADVKTADQAAERNKAEPAENKQPESQTQEDEGVYYP